VDQSTTVLFGLPGVRVQRVDLDGHGGRLVHVETGEDPSASGCPTCGVVSTSVKGNVVTGPVDLPYGSVPLTVRWHKRRWRCREASCERFSFTESITEVPAGARTTGRLRSAMGAAVGDAARSVAEVANAFGVSWPTAHAAFVEHAEALFTEPAPTTVLGIDETRRGKPRWVREHDPDGPPGNRVGRWRRVDPYDTGFVDLAGDQGLLGQREGRTSQAVVDWLSEQSQQLREGILFVAIDPAAVYAKAVGHCDEHGNLLLPNARLVVDHFHLVKLANDCVTKVRRRTIWEQKGRRGRKLDPAWVNRRRLLTGHQRLRPKAFTAMWNSLIDSDPSGQILAAWIAKEELRTLLALARTDASRDVIAERLYVFYAWCASTSIDEVHTLAGTVETWWPEIEAFIDTGITNAKTEGLNRLIKQVKRSGCGFRNVTNQHRRVRFHCTRTARAATTLSSQLPGQV
jgi:transposase